MKQNTYGAEVFLIVLLFMFLLTVFTLFRILPLGGRDTKRIVPIVHTVPTESVPVE